MRPNQINPKTIGIFLIIGVLFSNCNNQSEPALAVMYMVPLEVGTKTPDYEIISPTELKLSPGAKIKNIKGANGENNGFILLRDDGTIGGYMSCGCSGATIDNCVTENDSPENASCSGGCTDSEGNNHTCQLTGLIGPSRDAFKIQVVDREEYEKSILAKYR